MEEEPKSLEIVAGEFAMSMVEEFKNHPTTVSVVPNLIALTERGFGKDIDFMSHEFTFGDFNNPEDRKAELFEAGHVLKKTHPEFPIKYVILVSEANMTVVNTKSGERDTKEVVVLICESIDGETGAITFPVTRDSKESISIGNPIFLFGDDSGEESGFQQPKSNTLSLFFDGYRKGSSASLNFGNFQ